MNIIEVNHKWNGKLTYGNRPGKIILHHAEASVCTVQDIHRWHLNFGWTGIGYHFFVRKDGSVYRGRPENTIGAHVSGANTNTLGICAEGSYMSETMPKAQKQAIKDLIKHLDSKYGKLPVYGHREVGSSNCPGTNYPLAELKSRDNSVQPSPSPTPNKPSTQWVLNLQKELNKQGFKDKNGNKLVEDGLTGPLTLSACPLLKKGAKGNITRLMQEKLNVATDGIFGSDTLRAVKELQRKKNLIQDGIVGQDTWKVLIYV